MGRSSYPGQFDSDVELPRVDNNVTDMGAEAINALRDAIFSIEEAIGVKPQGNMDDLVTRVNMVIDENGHIQTSALAARGLITLPIHNSQIDIDAGIEERKLDLDYPTATLYGIIQSAQTDIDAIRTSFNAFTSRTVKHFLGTGDRHDGYQIDLKTAIMSKTNVENALHELANAFTVHTTDLTIAAHPGQNISLVNDFYNIDSTDVQDAIEQLDLTFTNIIETHQDTLHANGIGIHVQNDAYQGNVDASVFGSTIFKTETSKATNILQVMRPNVARITSKNINPRGLSAGTIYMLRIQAGGIGRTHLDVNLTAIIPTDDIDKIVEAINSTAHGCSNHYPISAYNTGGQLTIAHTIPGEPFTISILSSVSFSAATVLGFGEVVDQEFSWSHEEHAGYVSGHRIKDFKSLIKVHYNHVQRPLSRIALGLGDLTQYGLSVGNEGRVLCNITNHSTNSADNGTHYIVTFLDNETFVLAADITNGECDLEIAADAVNFENSASGELYDIFVENAYDGYGIVTKRSRVSYGPIAGISLRTVSKDFPTNNVEWQVDDNNYLTILEDSIPGTPVLIPTGYLGPIEVFAANNIGKAVFELTSTPSVLKRSMSVNPFAYYNELLYISSVHYGGNFGIRTLKYVTDKRLIGSSLENFSEDALSPLPVDDALNELRNNGVIRGFDIISYTNSSFKIRGGKALVNGKVVNVPTRDFAISDFTAATRLLLLDHFGNYVVKSPYEPGFTMEELTDGDSYGDNRGVVPLLEFETNGTALDGYFYDRRLIVGKIDKKLFDATNSIKNDITQIQNVVGGSIWANSVIAYNANEMAYAPWDYLANITRTGSDRLTDIDAVGFTSGSSSIKDRRFELNDTYISPIKKLVYSPGMTHINIYIYAKYYGDNGGPFGVSDEVTINVGAAITTGISDPTNFNPLDPLDVAIMTRKTTEAYAPVKTISFGVLPSAEVAESYVASIPISLFNLSSNTLFDLIPRIKITNATKVDGGPGDDDQPILELNYIRVVTSSYSIAGYINNVDGSSEPVAAIVGAIL